MNTIIDSFIVNLTKNPHIGHTVHNECEYQIKAELSSNTPKPVHNIFHSNASRMHYLPSNC